MHQQRPSYQGLLLDVPVRQAEQELLDFDAGLE